MIDTVKIYTMINKEIYTKIYNNSIIKTSFRNGTGEIFYNIVNDHLKGSYDSSLSVRVDNGSKYGFVDNFFIEIEGSYHKIVRGYNSHHGFYDLLHISQELVKIVENAYNVKLPQITHWFLQRVDVAICFDLKKQDNVKKYLNNLHSCDFPRRVLKNYGDFGGTGIYFSGTTTTLKIYNKFEEFKKHDLKKFKNTNFDIINYLDTIKGFIRFEVEIKKKKLVTLYNKNYIRIININYDELKKIWCDEFMKLLKLYENDLKIVRSREDVENRLFTLYTDIKARRLYNFYLTLIVDGIDLVKKRTSRNVYYTNIRDLKKAGVDFSQKLDVNFNDDIVDFDPFTWNEVI